MRTQEDRILIERMLKVLTSAYLFYSADPSRRGVDGHGGCFYLAPNGNKCAVGRCMKKNEIGPHLAGDVVSLIEERDDEGIAKPLDSLLTKSHQGLPAPFWHALQVWHDNDMRWYPNANHRSLTEGGTIWGEVDHTGVYEDYIILHTAIAEGAYCTRA